MKIFRGVSNSHNQCNYSFYILFMSVLEYVWPDWLEEYSPFWYSCKGHDLGSPRLCHLEVRTGGKILCQNDITHDMFSQYTEGEDGHSVHTMWDNSETADPSEITTLDRPHTNFNRHRFENHLICQVSLEIADQISTTGMRWYCIYHLL